MRLINTATHLLESKFDLSEVKYAILSHTWGTNDDEVTFQEWELVHDSGAIKGQCPHIQEVSRPGIMAKPGYAKIIEACNQAKKDGLNYLWCDTNCINKESSAELSEAINSMFAWYRQSQVCYAYLSDVRIPNDGNNHAHSSSGQGWFARHAEASDIEDYRKNFSKSRWWSRGWTLQELLAPDRVAFFDANWMPLGAKTELADWITDFTTIHKQALESPATIPDFSIAQRMSWAAKRTTSVPEDLAYCLLGIFDISMPMLYGQGSKAFMKLQEEIIRVSDDMSILAWQDDPDSPPSGVLAPSPLFFRQCGDIAMAEMPFHLPFSVTNFGLSMKLPLLEVALEDISLAQLNCCRNLYSRRIQKEQSRRKFSRELSIWIPLKYIGSDRWLRTHYPVSQVYLEDNYEDAAEIHAQEVFLSVTRPLKLNVPCLTPTADVTGSSSGFFLTVGAGTTSTAGYFQTVFPFPVFSSTVLSGRKRNGLSHLLVSDDAFTSIFSIAWRVGDIVGVRFTTVNATRLHFLRSRDQSRRTWQDVLVDGDAVPGSDAQNEATALERIHRSIRLQFGSVTEEGHPSSPSVRVSPGPHEDLWGQLQFIISYVVRQVHYPQN